MLIWKFGTQRGWIFDTQYKTALEKDSEKDSVLETDSNGKPPTAITHKEKQPFLVAVFVAAIPHTQGRQDPPS